MPSLKNMVSHPAGAIFTIQALATGKANKDSAMDWGEWMWFVIDLVAVAILGGAIAYGSVMWRQRPQDPETQRRSDETTRELYNSSR